MSSMRATGSGTTVRTRWAIYQLLGLKRIEGGASAKRVTQGNVVIANLKDWGYRGAVLPVHPQAGQIDGPDVVVRDQRRDGPDPVRP